MHTPTICPPTRPPPLREAAADITPGNTPTISQSRAAATLTLSLRRHMTRGNPSNLRQAILYTNYTRMELKFTIATQKYHAKIYLPAN